MKNKLLLLTSLLVLVFSSCKNIEQGTSNKATATVSFAADNSRAIFKEHSKSDYTYTIIGTSDSGTTFQTDKKYTYNKLSSARFEIQQGTWNFTMDAYAGDEPAFRGTKSVTITNEPVSISIPLSAVTGSAASLSVKLNYPENKGVAKITAGLYDSVTEADAGSALTLDAGFVTYTNDDVPAATSKILKFYLYDCQDVCIGSFIEGLFLAASDSVTVERTLLNVNTFAATVSLKDVNGDDYIDSGLLVKAVKGDKKYPMTAVSGTNIYTASLPVGTYNVYAGQTDTGADLTITFINGGNASFRFDYQVCSFDTFASMISSLTEDTTIVLTGEPTNSDLRAIKNAINNSTYKVNLDLSNTTGVTLIPDNPFMPENPFEYCSNLSGITIPDSVTYIGNNTFSGCTALSSVTIPDSVTTITNYAFSGCTSLSSVTIGDSVTYFDSYALYGCTSLTAITVDSNNTTYTSIDGVLFNKDSTILVIYPQGIQSDTYTIPDSVTSIGLRAFGDCTSLSSVTIPDSVTSIGKSAFYKCSSLSSVTIPDSVTSIGNSAFRDCTSLSSVTIGDSVTSIGSSAFRDCTSLSSVTIGDSVTSIGDYAFYKCTSLSSVTMPDSVTFIGSYAFQGCTSLSSVTIPDSVTSIGSYAFQGCTSLSSVTIGDSVTSIGKSAFYSCILLSSVTIPDSVISIGENAFLRCTSLSSVTIPDSVTSIGDDAFSGCSSLSSVTIGDSVVSIGINAFQGCTSLSSIDIPDSVTSIGNFAFSGCSSLSSVTIPHSVISIGENAFYRCTSLASVTIPDSVTSIGSEAFYSCTSLTAITVDSNNANYSSIDGVLFNKDATAIITYPASKQSAAYTIPDSVTYIGDRAFGGCTSLSSVTIPESITTIGDYAFAGCSKLTSITFADTTTWYQTNSSTNWNNKTGGTETDVSDAATNATYFTDTYKNYYWYKLNE